MELYDPQTIRYIRNKFGFRFSKELGQNFLTDKTVIDDIVGGARITEDDLVIEIGPGIGVLTQACLEKAGKVIAVEVDQKLLPVLDFTLGKREDLKIVFGDILKIDIPELIREEKSSLKNVKIVGNLPYYITTSIIMKLLKVRLSVESITIMMQKEVADRILAEPGGRTYGALSVSVQYYSAPEKIALVPKEAFVPVPKVDSAVLRLDIREKPAVEVESEEMFFRTVRAGFGQRRKTLSNSLRQTGASREMIADVLGAVDIPRNQRAEKLTLEEFGRIADEFTARGLAEK